MYTSARFKEGKGESELFKCYMNVILATKGQIKSGSRLKPSTKRGDKFIDQGFNWQLGGQ